MYVRVPWTEGILTRAFLRKINKKHSICFKFSSFGKKYLCPLPLIELLRKSVNICDMGLCLFDLERAPFVILIGLLEFWFLLRICKSCIISAMLISLVPELEKTRKNEKTQKVLKNLVKILKISEIIEIFYHSWL